LPNTAIPTNEIAEMTTSDRVQTLALALTFCINFWLNNFIDRKDITSRIAIDVLPQF